MGMGKGTCVCVRVTASEEGERAGECGCGCGYGRVWEESCVDRSFMGVRVGFGCLAFRLCDAHK